MHIGRIQNLLKRDFSQKTMKNQNEIEAIEIQKYLASLDEEKRPISKKEFESRCTRHLNWRESGTGNPWRIWSAYDNIRDNKTLNYYLCWTPVAELGKDGDESDSDSDL